MLKRVILVSLLLIVLTGCSQKAIDQERDAGNSTNQITGNHIIELEKTVCNSADKAGTCMTRLAALGFITKEECCEKYQKCC
jgi:PBP1b-binding outer membrane lipoprotein LpoB